MREKLVTKTGLSMYDIEFNNVKAPASSLLGSRGAGLDISRKLLENALHLVGALSIGVLKSVYKETIKFCINAKRFDKSLSEYDIIKERIARIETRLYTMESMVYMTAGIVDSFEVADVEHESAMTKIFCTDSLKACLGECMEILAMAAYSLNDDGEGPLKNSIQDANFLSAMLNTNDILRVAGKEC